MTFKYSIYKRWFPIAIAPVFLFFVYLFLRAAFQMGSYFYSLLFLFISVLMVIYWFFILSHCRTQICINQKRLTINRPFKSIKFAWSDIAEYGRDRIFVGYTARIWRYHVRTVSKGKKKIILCQEDLKDFKVLSDFINEKLLKH